MNEWLPFSAEKQGNPFKFILYFLLFSVFFSALRPKERAERVIPTASPSTSKVSPILSRTSSVPSPRRHNQSSSQTAEADPEGFSRRPNISSSKRPAHTSPRQPHSRASYSTLTLTRSQCVAQQSLNLYRMQRAARSLVALTYPYLTNILSILLLELLRKWPTQN